MCNKEPDTLPPPALYVAGTDLLRRSWLVFASDPKQTTGSSSGEEVTHFPNMRV